MTRSPVDRLRVSEQPTALIREMAREDLVWSASNQVAIVALLTHEDPDVRACALELLCVRWRRVDAHDLAVQAMLKDADSTVRGGASYALVATSTPSSTTRDRRHLVAVLRNEIEEPDVRRAAYDGLLILSRRPAFPTMLREFDPTTDVDWDWVDELTADSQV